MDINRNNYEEFFLLCLDGELSPSENRQVEEFLSEHADLQKEFALLQQAILPATEMLFEPKELLFRREEKPRVVPFYKMRVAAVVALILAGSWFVLFVVNSRASGKRVAEGKETVAVQVKQTADGQAANANTNLSSGQPVTKTDNAKTAKLGSPSRVAKIKRQPSRNDRQASGNDLQEESSEKQETAMQKKSVASIQPAESMNTTKDPTVPAEARPTTLTIAAAGSNISVNAVPLKSEDQSQANNQTDNAISVIALNEKNKSITGFFKKLTRRAAPDPNERKLRVSVFQFSY